jgi:hypothetical protein
LEWSICHICTWLDIRLNSSERWAEKYVKSMIQVSWTEVLKQEMTDGRSWKEIPERLRVEIVF